MMNHEQDNHISGEGSISFDMTSIDQVLYVGSDDRKPPVEDSRGSIEINVDQLSVSRQCNSSFSGNSHAESVNLLSPLSFKIPSTTLFGILGGSGSGKTTLLNIISGRYDKKAFKVNGSIKFILRKSLMKTNVLPSIGYLTQHDLLFPYLTIRETLLFVSRLKVSPCQTSSFYVKDKSRSLSSLLDNTSSYDRLVENVAMELGLIESIDALIGNESMGVSGEGGGKKGLSGGERRRVSIAVQLLTNPQVLCADEPTSGLDSFTAISVMECLKRLTTIPSRKTTVIVSIHQPRSDLFQLFDSILLLTKGGNGVYCGPTQELVSYFSGLGYSCPSFANPADFFIDLTSLDFEDDTGVVDEELGKKYEADKKRIDLFIKTFQQRITAMSTINMLEDSTDEVEDKNLPKTKTYRTPFFIQLTLLFKRFLWNNYRDPSYYYGALVQAIISGLVTMALFWQLSDSSMEDVSSRSGLMFVALRLEPYLIMMTNVSRYCFEMKTFDREIQDELYHPVPYLCAHVLSLSPQFVVQGILYSLPIYFGCNLRNNALDFILFVMTIIIMIFVNNGLLWIGTSINRNFSVVELFVNGIYMFLQLTSGCSINYEALPLYVKWVPQVNYMGYAYKIVMRNEFHDREFGNCLDPQHFCVPGNKILEANRIYLDPKGVDWILFIGIGCIYYIVAMILLTSLRFPPIGSVSRNKSKVSKPAVVSPQDSYRHILTEDNENENENMPKYEIDIKEVSLFTRVPKSSAHPEGKKRLLNNINGTISPGRMTALMGGSGSGKSTLLNLLANRIPYKCLQQQFASQQQQENKLLFLQPERTFIGTGSILYNKQVPTLNQITSSIAYVPQFDYHFESLTVYEVLQYHARLRLPMISSKKFINRRVRRILMQLGLLDCAMTRIGNDITKGISGGEKRRLSIGLELLEDVSICFFDEPTTGLDAFSAYAIVEILKNLSTGAQSEEQRTVIVSIHQPRFDIFQLFDDILLLSRGDLLWSGSISSMMNHFSTLGYSCPEYINPADFILDLSSIDFRNSSAEKESRARLKLLISSFRDRNLDQDYLKDVEVSNEDNGNFREIELCQNNADAHEDYPQLESESVAKDEQKGKLPIPLSAVAYGRIVGIVKSGKRMKPFYFTIPILFSRLFQCLIRDHHATISRIKQPILLALILACFYAPIGNDQASVQNRIGILYQLNAYTFVGLLSCVEIFPSQRNIFYREYYDQSYSSMAFLFTYFCMEIPMMILTSIIVAIIIVFGIGLASTGSAFLQFSFVIFTFVFTGQCLGVVFCLFSLSSYWLFTESGNLCGLISLSLPTVLIYLSKFTPNYWGTYVLTNVTFQNRVFSCEDIYHCTYPTGSRVLEVYSMNDEGFQGISFHTIMLGIVSAIYFIIVFMMMQFRLYQMKYS